MWGCRKSQRLGAARPSGSRWTWLQSIQCCTSMRGGTGSGWRSTESTLRSSARMTTSSKCSTSTASSEKKSEASKCICIPLSCQIFLLLCWQFQISPPSPIIPNLVMVSSFCQECYPAQSITGLHELKDRLSTTKVLCSVQAMVL